MKRKTIDQYAQLRSNSGNMIEKAVLNQPMQNFKVTSICSQPLTQDEKDILSYAIMHAAMKGKYITNRDIDTLRSATNKIGLKIDRDLELCKL